MTHLLRSLLAMLLWVALPAQAGQQPTDDPQASAIWQKVRASLFDNRPIAPAPADMMVLEKQANAKDDAEKPKAIK